MSCILYENNLTFPLFTCTSSGALGAGAVLAPLCSSSYYTPLMLLALKHTFYINIIFLDKR